MKKVLLLIPVFIAAIVSVWLVMTPKGSNFQIISSANPIHTLENLTSQSPASDVSSQVGSLTSPPIATDLSINGDLNVKGMLNSNAITFTPMSRPSNPTIGEEYFDKKLKQKFYWNGTDWVAESVSSLFASLNPSQLLKVNTINIGNLTTTGTITSQGSLNGNSVNTPLLTSQNGKINFFNSSNYIDQNGNLVIVGNITANNLKNQAGNFISFAPNIPQTNSSSNPSIFINNTAGGSLLNLENNGSTILSANGSGLTVNGTLTGGLGSTVTGFSTINGARITGGSLSGGSYSGTSITPTGNFTIGTSGVTTSLQGSSINILNQLSDTASPTGSTINGASLFVNPATDGGNNNNLLMAAGVGNNPPVMTLDASGNLTISGTLVAGGGGSGSSGFVKLAPSSAQANTTTNPSIFINSTGGGSLLDLQNNGSDVLIANGSGLTVNGGLSGNATGSLTGFTTIDGATISGGTLSGGSYSGTAITPTGNLSIGSNTFTTTLLGSSITASKQLLAIGLPTGTSLSGSSFIINPATNGGSASNLLLAAGVGNNTPAMTLDASGNLTVNGTVIAGGISGSGGGLSGVVHLAPASADTNAGGNSSIYINNSGTGNLATLENNGTNAFTIGNTGQTFIGATPQSSSLSGSSFFINPATNGGSGSNLLMAAGVNSANKLTLDANGNLVISGDITAANIGGGSGGGMTGAVALAPSSAQANSTTNPNIFINNTGGGSLLELQSNGLDELNIGSNGNATLGGTLTASGLTINGGISGNSTGAITGFTTINGATISGGTLSGGNVSGGAYSGTSITPTGNFTVGSNSFTTTLQGSTVLTSNQLQANGTPAGTTLSGASLVINPSTNGGNASNLLLAAGVSTNTPALTLDTQGNLKINGTLIAQGVSGGGGNLSGVVALNPSTPQTDSGTNTSIAINNTTSGNLLNLESNGTTVVSANSTGATINGTLTASTIQGSTLSVSDIPSNTKLQFLTGTTNLFTNPSFEEDTNGTVCASMTGYGAVGTPSTCQTDNTTVYIGSESAKIASSAVGDGISQTVSGLTASTTYTASAYVYVTAGSAQLKAATANMTGTANTLSNQWTRISVTFTTGSSQTSETVDLLATTASTTLWTDAWQLESGSTPTEYIDGSLGAGVNWQQAAAPTSLATSTSLLGGNLPGGTSYYQITSTTASGQSLPTSEVMVSTSHLSAPSGVSISTNSVGGAILPGTYYYKVTAIGTGGGETVGSAEVTTGALSGNSSSVTVSWSAVTGAASYNVYVGSSPGAESTYFNTTATSYFDICATNCGSTGASWVNSGKAVPYFPLYSPTSTTYNGYLYELAGGNFTNPNVVYAKTNSDGSISSWANTTQLPVSTENGGSIVVNGYIYYIGGQASPSAVYYAKLNADGTIPSSGAGTWTATSSLPTGLYGLMNLTVTSNGYIYVIGGQNTSSVNVNTVYYAKPNADGTIPASGAGAWTTTTASPMSGTSFAAGANNGYLYVIGYGGMNVYYAKPNADGTIPASGAGTWTATTQTANEPSRVNGNTIDNENLVIYNNYIFLIAGTNTANSADMSDVEYSTINADGTINAWSFTTSLPNGVGGTATTAQQVNGYIYVYGDTSGSSPSQFGTFYKFYLNATAPAQVGTVPTTNTAYTNTNANTITWTPNSLATGYKVYKGSASGGENLVQSISGGATSSFTDIGVGWGNGYPPIVSTTLANINGANSTRSTGLFLQNAQNPDKGIFMDDGGDLVATGNVNLTGQTVATSILTKSLGVGNTLTVGGGIINEGNSTVDGSLSVIGTSTLSGNIMGSGTNTLSNFGTINGSTINNNIFGATASATELQGSNVSVADISSNTKLQFLTGVTNLMSNPSFEKDSNGTACSSITSFAKVGTPTTCVTDNSTAYAGSESAKIASSAVGDGISQTVSGLTASTTYTASAYVYVTAGGAQLKAATAGITGTANTLSSQWTRISVTFTTGSSQTSETIDLLATTASTTLWTDAWQLETGSSASEYVDGSLGAGVNWQQAMAPTNVNVTTNVTGGNLSPGSYYYQLTSTATSGESLPTSEVSVTTSHLAVPSGVGVSTSTTGGQIPAGTYYYKVTAVGTGGGETTFSSEVSITTTGTTSSNTLTWNAVSGAASYNIYVGTSSGGETLYSSSTTTTFLDLCATSACSGLGNSWSTVNTNTIYNYGGEYMIGYKGYMYLFNSSSCSTTVLYAKINTDGTLASWQSTSTLAQPSCGGEPVVLNGYMYFIGGSTAQDCNSTKYSSVYVANINTDGTLGAFTLNSSLPVNICSGQAHVAVVSNYIYVLQNVYPMVLYYAGFNSDGSINGSWSSTNFVTATSYTCVSFTSYNGYLYVVGGSFNSGLFNNVYYAKPNADGTISSSGSGAWAATSSMTMSGCTNAAAVGGYVFALGLANGAGTSPNVAYAKLNSDGTIPSSGSGAWAATTTIPGTTGDPLYAVSSPYLYVFGQVEGSNLYDALILGAGTTSCGGTCSIAANTAYSNTNSNTITWTINSLATGYKIYESTTSGGENVRQSIVGGSTSSFTDIGSGWTSGYPPLESTISPNTYGSGSTRSAGLFLQNGLNPTKGVFLDSSGDLVAQNNVTLNGLTLANNLIAKSLGTVGTLTVQGNIVDQTNASILGTLSVTGDTTESGNLSVVGNLTGTGSTSAISGFKTIDGATLSGGTLTGGKYTGTSITPTGNFTVGTSVYTTTIQGSSISLSSPVISQLNITATPSSSSYSGASLLVNPSSNGGSSSNLLFAAVLNGNAFFTVASNTTISLYNENFTQIAAPTSPTVAVNATAGNLNGTYTYVITFVTANGETQGGTVSASVSPASQQVNLTNIPTSSNNLVTSRKIYRTQAGGSTYTLVTTLNDDTTTNYTDNASDASIASNAALPTMNTTGGAISVGGTIALQLDQSGNIGIKGHIIGNGTALTSSNLTLQSGAGTGASATLTTATDQAGVINLTTGTASWGTGAQVVVTFNTAYSAVPKITLTAENANAAAASTKVYVTATTTGFTINFASADAASTAYIWDYQVIQ